jgi:hypothetical protein
LKGKRDKDLEEPITALPLSYLARARAGIEPATGVIFQAFAKLESASTAARGDETVLVFGFERCSLIGIRRAGGSVLDSFQLFGEGLGFDFFDPMSSSVRTGGESGNEIEDVVAEAADVEDVLSVGSLRGGVRNDVDADELRFRVAVLELFPFDHHGGSTVGFGIGPGFVIGNEDH